MRNNIKQPPPCLTVHTVFVAVLFPVTYTKYSIAFSFLHQIQYCLQFLIPNTVMFTVSYTKFSNVCRYLHQYIPGFLFEKYIFFSLKHNTHYRGHFYVSGLYQVKWSCSMTVFGQWSSLRLNSTCSHSYGL